MVQNTAALILFSFLLSLYVTFKSISPENTLALLGY